MYGQMLVYFLAIGVLNVEDQLLENHLDKRCGPSLTSQALMVHTVDQSIGLCWV